MSRGDVQPMDATEGLLGGEERVMEFVARSPKGCVRGSRVETESVVSYRTPRAITNVRFVSTRFLVRVLKLPVLRTRKGPLPLIGDLP